MAEKPTCEELEQKVARLEKEFTELKESEEKYRLIIEQAVNPVVCFSLDGQIQMINTAAAKNMGGTPDEFVGKTIHEILPDKASLLMERISKIRESRSGCEFEDFIELPFGNYWFLSNELPVIDKNGEIIAVQVISSDITGKKLAEQELKKHRDHLEELVGQRTQALKESEERFRTLTEKGNDIIVIINKEGKYAYASPSVRQHGYSQEEIVGRTLEHFIHSEDLSLIEERYNLSLKNIGKTFKIDEFRIRDKKGSCVILEGTMTNMLTQSGVNGIVLNGHEITHRKQTEEELKKAKEEAETTNKAKSEFLANMSHEIRTPMNGVIGMTELLLDTDLTDAQHQLAITVKTSADSLLELINDILDFSKIEAGKLDIEEIDFDIRSMMNDFAATMVFRTEEKGLEFICYAAPEVPTFVKGDPGRLRQILTNLTGNSVKFTQKGEVAVLCRLEEELQNSCMLHFSIRDTGIGISKEKQAKLFKKFTQADSSTSREFGGTGLGLAISKQLSELMGGEIGIKSEEGKGSTLWFTVEFKKSYKKPEPLEIGNLDKAKIIFIDDNATNREVVGAMLSSSNIEHALAQKGTSGLNMLYEACDQGNPFNIAVIDMQMPGMDGSAVGKTIKSDEKLKETHLVLLTSMGSRGDAARFKEEGFAAFLTKPIRQSDLYDCLAQVMGIATYDDSNNETQLITRHSISENRKAKARLLIVEDNSTNRIVAKAILKKIGYSADVAVDGLDALRALKETPYDLVFMDLQMPVMGGIEATREIRNTESDVLNHKIPIIALTANAMKGDREMCIKAGMDDYLAKPIITEKVIKVLEKWLPKDKVLRTESLEDAESAKNTGDNSTDNSEGPLLF